MKKKALWISLAVALTLIVTLILLTLIFHKGYLQKTDYDHVAAVSYNDVRIVARGGAFYLSRNGEIVSDGYDSIQSVNDAYASESEDWMSSDSLYLYDAYLARRSGESSYYLISSDGGAYVISGENLSLSEIRLPYLIFVNNTTGRTAVLSLDKMDSDLSYCSGNELTLRSFASVTPVRSDPTKLLYSHLETFDAASDTPYAVFSQSGSCLFSSSHFEKKTYVLDETQRAVYYRDVDTESLYATDGTLLGVGQAPLSESVGGSFGWMPVSDALLVLTPRKSVVLSAKDYRLDDLTVYAGSLALPTADGGEYALISGYDGTLTRSSSPFIASDGLIFTETKQGDVAWYSENGVFLMETVYTDMVVIPSLSDLSCTVLESASYNENTGERYLHFVREGSEAASIALAEGTQIEPLRTRDGLAVGGSFRLTEQGERGTVYRVLAPFSTRLLSDSYDVLDVFCQANILWARGASYERLTFSFLDPLTAQTATTVPCSEEDMADALFEFSNADSLLSDPTDPKSAVPILIVRLSYGTSASEENTEPSTVRHFAIYRSSALAAKTFSTASLRVMELGKALLRSHPFDILAEDNVIVCHDADSSRIYRLNDSLTLTEGALLPYHVTNLLHDLTHPSALYFVVSSETGKVGLYDEKGSPILAPYYDHIASADNGHFVVSLRGAYGVVEYTAGALRQILDYLYISVEALPDHAYLATNGDGSRYLYEGKDMLSDKAVQSCEELQTYFINDQSELCYRVSLLLSMDGALYLHDCETVYRPTVTQYAHAEPGLTDIRNQQATVVYYYHNGKQVRRDIIWPTPSAHAAFSLPEAPEGEGWYLDPMTDAAPISPDAILTEAGGRIRLYTKQAA